MVKSCLSSFRFRYPEPEQRARYAKCTDRDAASLFIHLGPSLSVIEKARLHCSSSEADKFDAISIPALHSGCDQRHFTHRLRPLPREVYSSGLDENASQVGS